MAVVVKLATKAVQVEERKKEKRKKKKEKRKRKKKQVRKSGEAWRVFRSQIERLAKWTHFLYRTYVPTKHFVSLREAANDYVISLSYTRSVKLQCEYAISISWKLSFTQSKKKNIRIARLPL